MHRRCCASDSWLCGRIVRCRERPPFPAIGAARHASRVMIGKKTTPSATNASPPALLNSISIKHKWALSAAHSRVMQMTGEIGMATPGELVRAVAEILGIPEATVVQYDRNLV